MYTVCQTDPAPPAVSVQECESTASRSKFVVIVFVLRIHHAIKTNLNFLQNTPYRHCDNQLLLLVLFAILQTRKICFIVSTWKQRRFFNSTVVTISTRRRPGEINPVRCRKYVWFHNHDSARNDIKFYTSIDKRILFVYALKCCNGTSAC